MERLSFTEQIELDEKRVGAFVESLMDARNLKDLRQLYAKSLVGNELSVRVSSGVYLSAARRITEHLLKLGLPEHDERTQILMQTAYNLPTHLDDLGYPNMGVNDRFANALRRILSGCDPSVQDELKLFPLEDSLFVYCYSPSFWQEVAMRFTKSDQYTIPTYHPRKARREISDPMSPYWGVSVVTDDWPTPFVNTFLWIPTGRLPRELIMDVKEDEIASPYRSMAGDDLWVPSMILAQSIQLGGEAVGVVPFDTGPNGLVLGTLKYIKQIVQQESD